MRLIAITPEYPFEGEAKAIERIIEAGFCRVHLRMPHATDAEAMRVMQAIRPELHGRIVLASHYGALAGKFAFGGVHIKAGMDFNSPQWRGMIKSRSYHRGDSFDDIGHYDYAFLSPVQDSISKQGYQSAFTRSELRQILACGRLRSRLVALGGVTAGSIHWLCDVGFTGAAFLGYLKADTNDLDAQLNKIKQSL